MLTNHPGCFWPLLDVNFTENAQAMYLSIHDMSLKITNSTLQLLLPGINELTDWLVYSSCDKDNSVTYSSGSCFSIGKLILSCSAILCMLSGCMFTQKNQAYLIQGDRWYCLVTYIFYVIQYYILMGIQTQQLYIMEVFQMYTLKHLI